MKSNISIIKKAAFIITGILLITGFVHFIVTQARELRIKRENAVKEGMSKIAEEIFKPLTEIFMFPFTIIMPQLKQVFSFIETIIELPIEIPHLLEGIINHIECGFAESADGVKYTLPILVTLIDCSLGKAKNFFNGKCTKYYIVNMIFGLFYGFFIELPIVLVYGITGIDLNYLVDLFYQTFIVPIDGIIFTVSGYHIIQWPDSVESECFKCTGNIPGVNQPIQLTFSEWTKMLQCSTFETMDGIRRIFTTILPSAKWWAWFKGRHLAGYDNQPSFL